MCCELFRIFFLIYLQWVFTTQNLKMFECKKLCDLHKKSKKLLDQLLVPSTFFFTSSKCTLRISLSSLSNSRRNRGTWDTLSCNLSTLLANFSFTIKTISVYNFCFSLCLPYWILTKFSYLIKMAKFLSTVIKVILIMYLYTCKYVHDLTKQNTDCFLQRWLSQCLPKERHYSSAGFSDSTKLYLEH